METITVSSRFQVVIPRKIRQALNIRPGQRMLVLVSGSVIQLISMGPRREYRGLARGIDTTVERDEADRV